MAEMGWEIRKVVIAVALGAAMVMAAVAQAGDTGRIEIDRSADVGKTVLTVSGREDADGKLIGVVIRDGERRVLYDGPAERWECVDCVLVRRSDGLAVLVSPDAAVTYQAVAPGEGKGGRE